MKKHVLGRLTAVLLSVTMAVSLLCSVGLSGKAQAASETWTKTVAGHGTSVIKAPATPASLDSPWTGSYVWYGKFKGEPVRYRVLAPKTTIYGGTTMLLESDNVLYFSDDEIYGAVLFDEDGEPNKGAQYANEWAYSDVRKNLNGSEFLTRANGFTGIERSAVAESTIAGHALTPEIFKYTYCENYVGLSKDRIFLLDVEDVMNPKYGYSADCGKTYDDGWKGYSVENRARYNTEGKGVYSWLRSAYYENNGTIAALVYPSGEIGYRAVRDHGYILNQRSGVCPAFNVSLPSVIFSSVVSGTAGKDNAEYKLTLADSDLAVGIQSGKTLTASGSKITVPYKITGNDASKATQVSVLILDKTYTAGNTNSAKIKYYGKLTTSGTFATNGTGTFTLPSNLSVSGWNSSYYVYLLAEDVNGIHETDYASTPLKLSAPGYPNINTQPVNKSLIVGSTAKFTVAAVGSGTLQYHWQFRKNSSSAWADSAQNGNKTNTLLVSTTAGMHGYQFRCVVSDSNGKKTYSNAATLTLKPKITTQPADKSLLVGSTAKFTVAATGKGTLTYQWQYRKNSSSAWANSGQQGAKTDTLLVSTTAGLHGYQFRCVVTDGNGQKSYSNAATLTLKPRITTQPVDKDLLVGSTAKFTIAATGKGTLKYQWQYRKNSSSEWADSGQSGNKTNTLLVSTTAGLHGYQFRCVVTDGNGQKSYSKTVTLTLKPRITTQPTDKSVTAGNKAKFTVAATGKATLTYQWQYRKNSSSAWADSGQSGNKTATLSVATTKALNGYQFRCIVTDGNGRKSYSCIVTLTVK